MNRRRALGFGSTLLRRSPDGLRHGIDVSGDGKNAHGYAPRVACREFPLVEVASGHADFEDAMRRKPERELGPPIVGAAAPGGVRAGRGG